MGEEGELEKKVEGDRKREDGEGKGRHKKGERKREDRERKIAEEVCKL